MSWSRFSPESDVYTFPTIRNGVAVLECCACSLMPYRTPEALFPGSFTTPSVDDFLTHLRHHRETGHDVPDGLEAEVAVEAHEYLDA